MEYGIVFKITCLVVIAISAGKLGSVYGRWAERKKVIRLIQGMDWRNSLNPSLRYHILSIRRKVLEILEKE